MSAHFVSLKGERSSNEDNHNIILGLHSEDPNVAKINYYAVYDGHGGKFVSNFLSKNLPPFFTSAQVTYPLDTTYVNNVYDTVQNTLFTKYENQATECGSTCLVVCHYKDRNNKQWLNVINTGDSRCVMCRDNIGVPLTKDHKPDWPDETKRIKQLGGSIRLDGSTYRIGDLSVSRAFGDKDSCKYVTHRPDIYKYRITPKDKFIIIACDGLWDVVSPQEAVNVILSDCYDINMKRNTNSNVNMARKLGEMAIAKDCGDNVTIIVVFFDID